MSIKSVQQDVSIQLPLQTAQGIQTPSQVSPSNDVDALQAQYQQGSFQIGAQDTDTSQVANFAQNATTRPASAQSALSLQISQGLGNVELQPQLPPTQPVQQASSVASVGELTEAQRNEQVVKEFYAAMENKDYNKIMSLYHPDAVFSDPAFPNISGKELQGMWKLITGNESLKVTSSNVKTQPDGSVTGHWDADYHIIDGNPIFNQIDSKFEFKDGKIIKHTDSFNFSKWADQAFPGILGKLVGTRVGHFLASKLIFPRMIK